MPPESHLKPLETVGYLFRFVAWNCWAVKPKPPGGLFAHEIAVGPAVTRQVLWSRLITSSGLLVDIVAPPSQSPGTGEILLFESIPDSATDQDPEIELARVESVLPAHFGIQLIRLREPIVVESKKAGVAAKRINWAVMEAIWRRRNRLMVRGVSPFFESEQSARKNFQDEAAALRADPLIESYKPTKRQITADAGKWSALKDIHPKTTAALEAARLAPDDAERARHWETAAREFGAEVFSMRKLVVWPARANSTAAIWPLDQMSAAERKSLGRRKLAKNPVARHMATRWISKGLADMKAVDLTAYLNERFRPSRPLTVAQIRQMRYRLQLFVDWVGSP